MSIGAKFETEHYRVMGTGKKFVVVRKADAMEVEPSYNAFEDARDYALRLEVYLPLYGNKEITKVWVDEHKN